MRGNNTDLRWAWGRLHLHLSDHRHRDSVLTRVLGILAQKASLQSWAMRRWRHKVMSYPIDTEVRLQEGALLLRVVITKHDTHRTRMRWLKAFQHWAYKVQNATSINKFASAVLNSWLSATIRRFLYTRFNHWARKVEMFRFKAQRVCAVAVLTAKALRTALARRALFRWAAVAADGKYHDAVDSGLNQARVFHGHLTATTAKASALLYDRREGAADYRRLVSSWMLWKQRNFTLSVLKTRRVRVLGLLRRCRGVTAMKAHALRRWRDTVLCTLLKERRLRKLPMLLCKLQLQQLFTTWRSNARHWAALQRMGRWLVMTRRACRLKDTKKAFFRWRTRVRVDLHAHGVLTALFDRFPKVVYRSTMRRWGTRVSRMKMNREIREKLSLPFETWTKYRRYWQRAKSRLDYVAGMARKAACRYVMQKWSVMARQSERRLRGLPRCIALHAHVRRGFVARAWRLWCHDTFSHGRRDTIDNLGRATNLALKRVISAEARAEETVIRSSLLDSQNRALREYQTFLLGHTCVRLADRIAKAPSLLMRGQCFHYWRRFVLLRRVHLHAVRTLVRNRRRVQVRHILGRRFLRWRRILEFSLVNSISERHAHGRYVVLCRRSKLSLLGYVFRRWRNRGVRFQALVTGTFRRLTRQRCRRHLHRAWMTWSRLILAGRMVEGSLRRSIAQRRVFFAWQRYVLGVRLRRTAGHRQALKMIRDRKGGKRREVMVVWEHYTGQRRRLRRGLGRMSTALQTGVLRLALQALRRRCQEGSKWRRFTAHLGFALARSESRRRQQALHSAFHGWRHSLVREDVAGLTFRYRREALKNVLSRWEWHSAKGPTLRALHHWRHVASEVSKTRFVAEGHSFHVRIMFYVLPSFLLRQRPLCLSYPSITACLHSLTPHDTSLTIIPPSLNRQSIDTILTLLVKLTGTARTHREGAAEGSLRSVVALSAHAASPAHTCCSRWVGIICHTRRARVCARFHARRVCRGGHRQIAERNPKASCTGPAEGLPRVLALSVSADGGRHCAEWAGVLPSRRCDPGTGRGRGGSSSLRQR
jgi:hypothetical protein